MRPGGFSKKRFARVNKDMKNRQNIDLEDVLSDRVFAADLAEIPLADKVFKFFSIFAGAIFVVIFLRLAYLNAVQGAFFESRAAVNMSDIKVQPSPRGIIFDRFGKPLTSNIPSNKVFLLPRDLPENPDERIRTVKNVSAILNLPWEDVKKTIEEKDWGQSDRMIISSDINHDTLMELTALDIRGIYIEPSFKRTYEFPLELSHVLGYTGLVNSDDMENDSDLAIDDEIGRLGLEAYYDGYLRGTNGEEVF